jgi:hypothetical protein
MLHDRLFCDRKQNSVNAVFIFSLKSGGKADIVRLHETAPKKSSSELKLKAK